MKYLVNIHLISDYDVIVEAPNEIKAKCLAINCPDHQQIWEESSRFINSIEKVNQNFKKRKKYRNSDLLL